MLVIRHEESGRLANPGGYGEPGETAQCTAHRETWEETGVAVRVGPLLTRFDNGFLLYGCSTPLEGTGKTAGSLVVPRQAIGEIVGVLWVDPANLRDEQWRFPEYFEEMKRLFVAADPD